MFNFWVYEIFARDVPYSPKKLNTVSESQARFWQRTTHKIITFRDRVFCDKFLVQKSKSLKNKLDIFFSCI
jgi:hypothetical protein